MQEAKNQPCLQVMNKQTSFFLTFASVTIGLGMLLILQFENSDKFRLIFCDIGQGDGMLLVTPGGSQIVVDGGPGNKILECLAKHMPFYDRDVEVIVSTHPQQDHMQGLIAILERYQVKNIAATGISHSTDFYKVWQGSTAGEGAKIVEAKAGEKIKVDDVILEVLWPPVDQLAIWQQSPPSDLNESAVVIKAVYGDFCAYLTGDAPKEILVNIMDEPCEVLKLSHHGSRTGTDKAVITKSSPMIAIAQLGLKNRYGHPHQEVLDAVGDITFLRNDLNGEVEVDSDGKGWSVRSDR